MLAHIGDKSDFPQFLLWQQHLTVLLLVYCIDFSKKKQKKQGSVHSSVSVATFSRTETHIKYIKAAE